MAEKAFFREQTIAKIKRKKPVEIETLSDIASLKPDEFTVISPIEVPGYDSSRKFMKHGPEVKLRRFRSFQEAVECGMTPVQLREEAFNGIRNQGNNFCGYSFMPLGRDRRKRKVSLLDCVNGEGLFTYSHQSGERIKVKAYADAQVVRREGAEVVIEVPSRREGEEPNQLKLISVPFVDSPEKYVIALSLGSDHSCPAKRFNIRYRYRDDKESSGVVNLCVHEIAGYLELIQQEWERNKNLVPLQMCQFAIPTQATVDYALRWGNNVLVEDDELKTGFRKPNRQEREIGLWDLVWTLGHDKTFFSDARRDGDLRDYRWKI